jgi:hypothetical protein
MNLPDRFSALVLGAVLVATAAACSPTPRDEQAGGGQPPCFPPSYSVSPARAKPGDVVTVAAPAADCNPRYGDNSRIQVVVTDKSGTEVISATSPMTDAGEFTYTFTVPAEIVVGEATVTAMPHMIDWCDDTGRNNRADRAVSLERTSCATPVESLMITR